MYAKMLLCLQMNILFTKFIVWVQLVAFSPHLRQLINSLVTHMWSKLNYIKL